MSFPWNNILNQEEKVHCTECGSSNVKYIRTDRYVSTDDSNPIIYKCNSCGKEFVIYG